MVKVKELGKVLQPKKSIQHNRTPVKTKSSISCKRCSVNTKGAEPKQEGPVVAAHNKHIRINSDECKNLLEGTHWGGVYSRLKTHRITVLQK